MSTLQANIKTVWKFCLSLFSVVTLLAIISIGITTCTMGSEDAWLLALLFCAPSLIVVSVLVYFSRNSGWNRWLVVPVIGLAFFALFTVSKYLLGVTLQGNHFCAVLREPEFNSYQSSWWARYWAPAMILAIALLCGAYLSAWFGEESSEK